MSGCPLILGLPDIALETILSFLSYDEIAKNRLVCNKFNQLGGKLLNRGFLQVEKRHAAIYKRMKLMLPRRESERRAHPLARHCDILSAVETRLSMLTMTYMKYIEMKTCCFIPGKIIDEIDNILTLIERANSPPRTHDLLRELRDISSMAMEHFDEVILPHLKQEEKDILASKSFSASNAPKLIVIRQAIANELHKLKNQTKLNKKHISSVMVIAKRLKHKHNQQVKLLREKSAKIHKQDRQIQEQAVKLQEQEATIADLKKHIEEWDQKFSDLTSELIRAREDLMTKSISPPTTPLPPTTPRLFKSNIKPRMALSRFQELPRVATDWERKRKPESTLEMPPYKIQRPSTSVNLSDVIYNKINETVTSNISQNITDSLNKITNMGVVNKQQQQPRLQDAAGTEKGKLRRLNTASQKGGGTGSFLSNSFEMLTGIRARKRKFME